MYAIIHTGGKQYRVAKNDVIQVEKLPGAAGETIDFGEVLMLGDGAEATVGAPLVDGARVRATILEQARGPKIIVFKKKRRKNYRRKKGHRQNLTVLRITDIVPAGAKPAKAKPKPAPAAEAPAKAAKPAQAKPAPAAEAPAKAAKPATAKPAKDAKPATDRAKAKPAKAPATKTSTKAKKSAKSDPSSKAGGKSAEEKG